jgi:hypothetical protein
MHTAHQKFKTWKFQDSQGYTEKPCLEKKKKKKKKKREKKRLSFEIGSYYVAQAGLKLVVPALGSCIATIWPWSFQELKHWLLSCSLIELSV